MSGPVRFCLDEHVGRLVRRALRQRGIDVETVAEAGRLGGGDVAHIARAMETSRVLVTQDADFLRLHAEGHAHAGIADVAQQTPPRRILDGLVLIHAVLDADDMVGHVEFL
ncbi:DUF5615 family PIN-like protein [Rubrivirga sp.]|uniref:DUF5615 family PIN-like protein n=1 Tax=Rubrivirga sp. TaxID=1885344 RepID=UPI003B52E3B1